MWNVHVTTDKNQILSFLEADRLYATYAIGDLEPNLFEQSTWIIAEREDRIEALTLHFRGLETPVLFLIGDSSGLQAILARTLRPEQVYFNCRERHLPLTDSFYKWHETIPMWRMALNGERFRRSAREQTKRLTRDQDQELRALYALGGADAFDPTQLEKGVFYGIYAGEELVSAAGTHLVSPTYGVAAVGNVFTHPAHRSQGYATRATSSVVAALLQQGVRDIILNVERTNEAAVHVYKKLGFETYCPFVEGPAEGIN